MVNRRFPAVCDNMITRNGLPIDGPLRGNVLRIGVKVQHRFSRRIKSDNGYVTVLLVGNIMKDKNLLTPK